VKNRVSRPISRVDRRSEIFGRSGTGAAMIRDSRDQASSPQKAGRSRKVLRRGRVLASAWADGNLHHPIKMGECDHIATISPHSPVFAARLRRG
jgi:hypothetical protein